MKKWLVLLFPFLLNAIDYAPWYGNVLEVGTSFKQTYQHYSYIRHGYHKVHKPSDNCFTQINLALPRKEDLKFEAELDLAETRHMNYNFEAFRFSVQTRPLNDIVLDPVSLNLGITLTLPSNLAVHDISLFQPGLYQGEFHVSVGKEESCESFWTSRKWADFAFGISNRGSPWFRAQATFEKNHWNQHHFKAQIEFLQGLGMRRVRPHHFHGWASIHFTSLDLKGAYFYQLCQGEIGLEIAYRPYSYNFPAHAGSIQISYTLPLAITAITGLIP